MRLVNAIMVGSLGLGGCSTPSGLYPRMPDEEGTYGFELVQSIDDSVRHHMLGVYQSTFSNPWNFRNFFQREYPQDVQQFYGYTGQKWTDDQYAIWSMRYALSPSSPEFSAIEWRTASLINVGDHRYPLRIAAIDLDNDGDVDGLCRAGSMGAGTIDQRLICSSYCRRQR